jgi:hypothetical protein
MLSETLRTTVMAVQQHLSSNNSDTSIKWYYSDLATKMNLEMSKQKDANSYTNYIHNGAFHPNGLIDTPYDKIPGFYISNLKYADLFSGESTKLLTDMCNIVLGKSVDTTNYVVLQLVLNWNLLDVVLAWKKDYDNCIEDIHMINELTIEHNIQYVPMDTYTTYCCRFNNLFAAQNECVAKIMDVVKKLADKYCDDMLVDRMDNDVIEQKEITEENSIQDTVNHTYLEEVTTWCNDMSVDKTDSDTTEQKEITEENSVLDTINQTYLEAIITWCDNMLVDKTDNDTTEQKKIVEENSIHDTINQTYLEGITTWCNDMLIDKTDNDATEQNEITEKNSIQNTMNQTYLENVKKDGRFLADITVQTELLCLEAVKQTGYALRCVQTQTDEICLEAVKQNGFALQHVKVQTEQICLEAVKRNGHALRYVQIQTDEICLEAVKQNGFALQHVKVQTEQICLEAVKQNEFALEHVKIQTNEICQEAIAKSSLVSKYVKIQLDAPKKPTSNDQIDLHNVQKDGLFLANRTNMLRGS